MDNEYRSKLRTRKSPKSNNSHNGVNNAMTDSPSEPKIETNGAAATAAKRASEHRECQQLVLWRQPLTTLYYFVLELGLLLRSYGAKLLSYRKLLIFSMVVTAVVVYIYNVPGSHQQYVVIFRKQFLWCAYWVGLGILSSVGLGTGLHTFLLYLGPHIAAVTLAAFECLSVEFPEPPYPEDIICPDKEGASMSILTIMSKVRLEAFMWGAGTAIGELPPYFMARASRLSGDIDEEERELEELVKDKERRSKLSILDRGKLAVHNLIQRVGFVGILLCASIPNPLFDLAGITCGHFLVPFSVFFGATLIGKAIIKMHIQKMFVIFLFSEHHVEEVVKLIKYIPYFGTSLQAPFKEYLKQQKAKLHHKPGTQLPSETSWLSWVFEKVVAVMVIYFVVSIVHSLANSYNKRLTSEHKVTQTKGKKK